MLGSNRDLGGGDMRSAYMKQDDKILRRKWGVWKKERKCDKKHCDDAEEKREKMRAGESSRPPEGGAPRVIGDAPFSSVPVARGGAEFSSILVMQLQP